MVSMPATRQQHILKAKILAQVSKSSQTVCEVLKLLLLLSVVITKVIRNISSTQMVTCGVDRYRPPQKYMQVEFRSTRSRLPTSSSDLLSKQPSV
jgi:hypothetical protein